MEHNLSSRAGTENGLHNLLTRESDFGNETGTNAVGYFEPGAETESFIRDSAHVLVIGAGGLGCEILKNLSLSGIQHIDVIDMDSIDVTNLNRQFLFREKDVGKMKSEVAAAFIMERNPSITVTAYTCAIQDKPFEFYQNYHAIIAGLDNIEARRWINNVLHSFVEEDDEGNMVASAIIPLIDGGSEAFKGQARVIIPHKTSCFECSMESFPPQTHFPLCTVAETPRKPEHCIAYVMFAVNKSLANQESKVLRTDWEAEFGASTNLDKDSPDHMQWLFKRALERAQVYGIEGVTYMLTMGVVKNIIPAVASTNAIIAAACVNETLKALSWCSPNLDNYYMYNGNTGVYSHTFEYGRKEGCPVCNPQTHTVSVSKEDTLQGLIDQLVGDPTFQLKAPSLTKPGVSLFMQNPPALKEATRPNLSKTLGDLLDEGDEITVTDPVLPGTNIEVVIKFKQ